MHRFFVKPEQLGDGRVRIQGEDVHHIRQVLRMRPGEEILVSCGDDWEYTCRVLSLEEREVLAEILDARNREKNCPPGCICFSACQKGIKWNGLSRKRWNWERTG